MLPDGHSLLDQVVQVLRQVRGEALGLEDPQDLVSGDEANLSHTVRVPQDHTWDKGTTEWFISTDTIRHQTKGALQVGECGSSGPQDPHLLQTPHRDSEEHHLLELICDWSVIELPDKRVSYK